jgi:hypothetical protein
VAQNDFSMIPTDSLMVPEDLFARSEALRLNPPRGSASRDQRQSCTGGVPKQSQVGETVLDWLNFKQYAFPKLCMGNKPMTSTQEALDAVMQEIEQTPPEYLPNLLQLVRIFRQSVTLNSAEESFRQGWHEAMTGQTIPLDELWDGIDAD